MAAAEGIVKATDRTLLAQNGGHINQPYTSFDIFISESSEEQPLLRFSPIDLGLPKGDIKTAVADGKIPKELVINWDQTGVNVVPASQWTQAEQE